jgi:hypothetical protein
VGDFRLSAPAAAVAPLLAAIGIGLVLAVRVGVRRRQLTLAVYPALALFGCLVAWLGGSTPWVVAKSLAIGSPALPAVALLGVAALWAHRRIAASLLLVLIAGGVLWSNALAYHDVTLAPKARLAELQRIAPLLAGHGPTLINEYDVYADRHFLRDGTPVEPAEYRPYQIPLAGGQLLTQSAQADLDAFSVQTLLAYPSIITRTSPVASRPSSLYQLRWQGRYYQLWQRPLAPAGRILLHVPFGDASTHPLCGQSTTGYQPLCSIGPVAPAPCSLVRALARTARSDRARLIAYQRPAPVVARADQTRWPGSWLYDSAARTLTPNAPGRLEARIALSSSQRYQLWLGGSFARGFEVSIDGQAMARVKNQLQNIGQYILVGQRRLAPGIHTISLSYPPADLTPGSGAQLTTLATIALQPLDAPTTGLISVTPQDATVLCGRQLDWIEVAAGH